MISKFSFSLKKSFLFSMMIAIVAFTSSCKKDDPAPQTNKNIVEIASADTSLSILVAAVVKADLATALSATNATLTVFAPTNAAFRELGYPSAAYVTNNITSPTDIANLKKVLLYHVLGVKVPSANISGTNNAVVTLNGDSSYVTKNNSGVFVNGVKVITADIAATNGVIHVINKVLIPPVGTLLQTALALGGDTSPAGFSLLVAAVLRGDMSAMGSPISAALSGNTALTVFAPTNQAFIDAGFPTAATINAAPAATIANILLYHVVPGRAFSSDLSNNLSVGTALGNTKKLTITLPPAKVKGEGNATASSIIKTDIVAKNGIIHVIDRVLLPL